MPTDYGTFKYKGIPMLAGGQIPTGNVLFVDAATGNDSADQGKTPKLPLATLDYAVGLCTADKGDIIYLMPNHYEDLAFPPTSGSIDLDVAGISVIGLGNGSNMPRIDFNHADSDFIVGANDVLIENVQFEATVTGVKLGVAIEAAVTGTTIRNCKFTVETTTTDEFVVAINLLAGCDNTEIRGCTIDQGLGGAAAAVKLVGASADVRIIDNVMKGDYSIANITGITTLSTEVLIQDNLLMNGGSGNVGAVAVISMLTGTTGYAIGNDLFCNLATVALMAIGDAMFWSRNYASEDVGEAAGAVLRTSAASVTAMADD